MSILPLALEQMDFYHFASIYFMRKFMLMNFAILAQMQAKAGKEEAVEAFLKGALNLANQEVATPVWFALKLGPSTYGIFDAFANEADREAHLSGPIALALMQNAPELLAAPPTIEKVQVLAAKLPA
jgi:quinol monooxygenase YgiN